MISGRLAAALLMPSSSTKVEVARPEVDFRYALPEHARRQPVL